MRHPFNLEPADLEALDLDFEEQLTEEEAARVGGGFFDFKKFSNNFPTFPNPQPFPTFPNDPRRVTTLPIGEVETIPL